MKSLDLRRKSLKDKVMVVEGSEQVESETKATPAVAVSFFEDTEDFKLADDVFGGDALFSELAVVRALPICQRFATPAFERGAAFRVNVGDALIATVS